MILIILDRVAKKVEESSVSFQSCRCLSIQYNLNPGPT